MRTLVICAAAATLLTACEDAEPIGPGETEAGTLTVDASEGWAFVDFDNGVALEQGGGLTPTVIDWDIAFNATAVMLNGGAAGSGEVRGYCICQNADATDAQVMAMTPASELMDFEQATSANLPQDGDWTTEALTPAINEWYAYDPSTHVVSPLPQNVYAVRTASGDAFAKLHVIGIDDATQTNAGRVTIEYAYQSGAGEAFAARDTVVLDASVGQRVLLEPGAVATAADWDVEVSGWDILLNGGMTGSGAAGAYLTGAAFDDVLDAGEAPAGAFSVDAFAGVFEGASWYRYDLGGNHQIWPTYEVYLIDTGDGVYKVQLLGYYSMTGESRHITFRYEQLD